ncbi:allophanate hydrolase subunit 1 [Streptomyces sp. NPDC046805]|uniref:5-oxoprolinase subunit B family protein n=1 Tax=Streptomyces sp. NPDC046805 TaxID=3155134 RepID=UPI0033DFD8BB
MTSPLRGVRRVGSTAVLAEVKDLPDVLALHAALERDRPHGVLELVPAARTLMVTYDPRAVGHDAMAQAVTHCAASLGQGTEAADDGGRSDDVLVIPVRYNGPDLDHAAELTGLSVTEVIRRHITAHYTVAFTGFAPGFGYLAGTDPALALPRRAEPRTAVPSGAVAVAGGFTGVYPRSSPGGWQLLGTTALKLWDPDRDRPALLTPGRQVRFVAEEPR